MTQTTESPEFPGRFTNAFFGSNPLKILKDHSKRDIMEERSILPVVKTLLDANLERKVRCGAAELLHEQKVTLAPKLIETVLNQGDSTFGRYALGLIPYTAANMRLIEFARNCDHSEDEAYRDELAILEKVVLSLKSNEKLSEQHSDTIEERVESAEDDKVAA